MIEKAKPNAPLRRAIMYFLCCYRMNVAGKMVRMLLINMTSLFVSTVLNQVQIVYLVSAAYYCILATGAFTSTSV